MTDTIIIIRGNSGSGKTTVAKELCKQLGKDCILLSQDVIRREILHTNDQYRNQPKSRPADQNAGRLFLLQ